MSGTNNCRNNKAFNNKKETLRNLIDDDLLYDSLITSRNVILLQKITKGEVLENLHIFNTTAEINVLKQDAIEQFKGNLAAKTRKIIKGISQNIRDEHTGAVQQYKTKKRK